MLATRNRLAVNISLCHVIQSEIKLPLDPDDRQDSHVHLCKVHAHLGLQWTSRLLAFIGVGTVFISYSFYFFGAQLRAKISCSREFIR